MGRFDRPNPLEKQYTSLEPRVKHVSEATIRKRWKKLPSLSHTATREAILSAKEQSRARNGRRATHSTVEDCVQNVSTQLIDRLQRIPFPPTTDEHHFDHEANLRSVRKLEEQLDANIHSIKLLEAQIAKEEELLRQDEAEVAHLDQSLKSREVYRRDRNKSLHPVARKLGQQPSALDLLTSHRESNSNSDYLVTDLFEDEELQPVLQQLRNHLENMSYNIATTAGVKEAVAAVIIDCEKYASLCLNEERYNQYVGDRSRNPI